METGRKWSSFDNEWMSSIIIEVGGAEANRIWNLTFPITKRSPIVRRPNYLFMAVAGQGGVVSQVSRENTC